MRQAAIEADGSLPKGSVSRTRKDVVLSFREGHVYMALKMVSPCDDSTETKFDPIPRIVFLVDGKYVRMPVDRALLKKLGTFMVRLSELLEGVKVPEKEIDLEEARRIISGYNNRRASPHPETKRDPVPGDSS